MEARVSCKTDTVHPRPQLRRETWMDLNGKWDFAVQADDKTPEMFDRTILVPYCPESALSGIHNHFPEGSFLFTAGMSGCRKLLQDTESCCMWEPRIRR